MRTWSTACLWAGVLSLLSPAAWAQGGGYGTIEGLVLNAASGEFLNNARVTVVGTNLETSTNAIGEYRLQVPAGDAVTISVAFTGMESQRTTVRVIAGQRVQQDFSLLLTRGSAEGGVVQMDAYTVQDREMTGQAIALQEQRNAPNIKNVVSLEEFGDMGEGNIGEFLKYVPGIDIAYSPQTPQAASIRGMPATGTLVMMNGTEMASSSDNTRQFDLGLSASGNIDRIEISKVPTPEMPANAVGGSINIIPKSSFSRRTPLFSYNLFLAHNALGGVSDIDLSLGRQAGSDPKSTGRRIQPAFNLSYILPINRSLGFTFALSKAVRLSDWERHVNTWDRVNGIQTQNRMGALVTGEDRELASISVDWKLWDRHVFSLGFQASNQTNLTRQHHFPVTAGAGATGGPNFTQGAPTGVGNVVQLFNTWTGQYKSLRHSTLTYRYDGRLWQVDGTAAWSNAKLRRKHADDGFFINITTSLPNLIVRYEGIGMDALDDRRVARITATDRAGNPVNVFDGDNYLVTAVQDNPLNVDDEIWRAGLNVRREFDFKVPMALKVGAVVNSQAKESVGGSWSMTFTPPPGPDGTDGRLARHHDLIAEGYSDRQHFTDAFGNQVKVRWVSPHKMYNLYQARPEWFTYTAANAAAWHTSRTNTSKKLQETISAAYVRGDVKLLNNRLWLVAGVRFERTDDEGWGPLNDIWNVYQRDANGNFIRNAAGALVFRTTDVYERALQQYTERGSYSKRSYDGFFPSFNSSFEITDNLIVRAAYARTIGRPNLPEIIPGIVTSSPDAPEANRFITVINSGLTPWTANNYDLTLESYGIKDAVATFSLFRKELSNFFGEVRTEATPELLAEFGLPLDFLDYEIRTKRNFGEAVIDGYEIAYRQTLDRWMPDWGRGLQVYINLTKLKLSGNNAGDFTGFNPQNVNWGVSYVRRRFIAKVNVALQSRIRGARAAVSATVPPDSYNYTAPQKRVHLSAEYRFSRRVTVYFAANNLLASVRRMGIDGPNVPEYAKYSDYSYTGAMFTLGVKGTF